MAQAVAPALATAFSGRRLETCRAPAPTSDLVASPWAPDRRCRAQAAVSRRSLLQAAVCASVARPTRVSAATFQAPAVSFLPPASTIPQRQELRTSMPKPHPGPPAFVQATGRIIASERVEGGQAVGRRARMLAAALRCFAPRLPPALRKQHPPG